MSIIRVSKDKKNPYFLMNKSSINDKRLSFKAKGILAYFLSKPDDWFINYNDLISSSTNGMKSVLSAIRELCLYGYMVRNQTRHNNGQFSYYDFTVFEKSQFHTETPKSINLKHPPQGPFRLTAKRTTDNSTLLSNEQKNIMTTNTLNGNSVHPVAADIENVKKTDEVINLLNSLNIKSHKKLFNSFSLDKLFEYSSWIASKKILPDNPTGFLISALKENWIDYEPKNSSSPYVLTWSKCPICNYSCGYERFPDSIIKCRKCKNIIDKKHYEKV